MLRCCYSTLITGFSIAVVISADPTFQSSNRTNDAGVVSLSHLMFVVVAQFAMTFRSFRVRITKIAKRRTVSGTCFVLNVASVDCINDTE